MSPSWSCQDENIFVEKLALASMFISYRQVDYPIFAGRIGIRQEELLANINQTNVLINYKKKRTS